MDEAVKRIVERLGLVPHPEGGFFREVYRADTTIEHPGAGAGENPSRAAGTLIYFLLAGDDFSAFHRVRHSDEIWHLYAGGPLEIFVLDDEGALARRVLTSDLGAGEPTVIVPGDHWQAARLVDGAAWALGGCTVAPGFEFEDFEMPTGDTLARRYPAHAVTIRQLTRR